MDNTILAKRLRVKLEDLLKASGDFISNLPKSAFTAEVRASYEQLDMERRIIRNQLDVLDNFARVEPTEGIKPCPFCGGESVEYNQFAMGCKRCEAAGPGWMGTEADAIFAWNQRTNSGKVQNSTLDTKDEASIG